jgi:hypothetical protein
VVARCLPRGTVEAQLLEDRAALLVRDVEQRAAVGVQHVEGEERDRGRSRGAARPRLAADVHPPLQPLEARPAVLAEGDQLAVEQHLARTERAADLAHLRIAVGDVALRAALDPHVAPVGPQQRADAVPLDLVAPLRLLARERQVAGLREHRQQVVGQRLAIGVRRLTHAVDHPVVGAALASAEREHPVAALQPLAAKGDLDLPVGELVDLVGAGVPDLHRPGAVAPSRDRAVEVEVLQRVVLGADRHPVVVRVERDAARQRPRGERALALEAQVPVQARGTVLLDRKAGRFAADDLGSGGRARLPRAAGLAGGVEVALGAVAGEAVPRSSPASARHPQRTYPRAPPRTSVRGHPGCWPVAEAAAD